MGSLSAAEGAVAAPAVWTPDLVEDPNATVGDPQLERFLKAAQPHPDDHEKPRRFRKPDGKVLALGVKVLIAVVVALGAAVALRAFVVSPYYIPSESMESKTYVVAAAGRRTDIDLTRLQIGAARLEETLQPSCRRRRSQQPQERRLSDQRFATDQQRTRRALADRRFGERERALPTVPARPKCRRRVRAARNGPPRSRR